jgi:hypothetical protein
LRRIRVDRFWLPRQVEGEHPAEDQVEELILLSSTDSTANDIRWFSSFLFFFGFSGWVLFPAAENIGLGGFVACGGCS